MNINSWLVDKGFGQYSELFNKKGITLDELPKITSHDDLKGIGIKSFIHRKKILDEITSLTKKSSGRAEPHSPSSPTAANKGAQIGSSSSGKGTSENIQRLHPSAQHKLNEYEEAIIKNKKDLNTKIKELGKEHEEVADIYYELGTNYYMNNQYARAINNHKKVLEIRIKCFGEDDVDVVIAYYQLGLDYYLDKNYKQAIINIKKALEIQMELNEDDDNNEGVAAIRFDLAKVYYYDDQYDKAIIYHKKALEIRQYIFGEENKDVGECYYQLGLVYQAKSLYDNALSHCRNAQKIFIETQGEYSDEARKAKDLIDELVENIDNIKTPENSAPYSQQSTNETNSDKSKNKIEKYITIGNDASESKEYDEALFHYENALRLCKDIPKNDENAETIATINFKLGTTSRNLEYYVQAEEYLHTAISGFVSLHGKNYFESARSYSQLGDVYYYVNDYKNAIINHSEALKSYTNVYGKEVPLVAWSHYDLGLDYYWIEDYEQSTDHFFRALSIRLTLYGINHDEVANCYYRLGLSFYWADKYEKSIKYHKYALEIREHLQGKESEKFDDSRFALAKAYYYANMEDKAKEYFSASLQFRKNKFGKSSKEYNKAKEWLEKFE